MQDSPGKDLLDKYIDELIYMEGSDVTLEALITYIKYLEDHYRRTV